MQTNTRENANVCGAGLESAGPAETELGAAHAAKLNGAILLVNRPNGPFRLRSQVVD